MFLRSLRVKDFRCFGDLPSIPIRQLTVFIGENDAGKTAILNALEILLTDKKPSPDDFRTLSSNGERTNTIIIGGTFDLQNYDTLPHDFQTLDGKEFRLTKIFTESNVRCEVSGRDFPDHRWNTFQKQKAAVQKELLQAVGLEPASNEEQRCWQFHQAVETGILKKEAATLEVKINELTDHLPRFEPVASTDYKHPDSMVQRTLQEVVFSSLHPENPDTGERELLPELKRIEQDIKRELDARIKQMYETLRRENPRLVTVEASPTIDFSRSVTSLNLMVDAGEGLRLVSSFGEGTKKKLWMGLLEWQRRAREEIKGISTIRVYDEPDVNLDYAAEKRLFASIVEATRAVDSRIQAVVCTHSVTFIDRAPGEAINLIKANEDGTRLVHHMENNDDEEGMKEFLETVGRSVGLTNSAFFYERSFLVVEGESEENALPIIYRNLYGRSYVEDGIVLINLFTCGAWKAVLKLLGRQKAPITVLFLDSDCKAENSTARVTPRALLDVGYPEYFRDNSCFYIGDKEFEDAFSSQIITEVLNSHWPKEDGALWTIPDVDQFRQPGRKFSAELVEHVRLNCEKKRRSSAKKPEFAERLARDCKDAGQVPEAIHAVFGELRKRAGCDSVSLSNDVKEKN